MTARSDHNPQFSGLISKLLEQSSWPDAAAISRDNKDTRGPCPFCRSSDGFSADDDRGVWRCHGCHAGGGVRDIARELGIDWKQFAEHHGIRNSEETAKPKRPRATGNDLKATWDTASDSVIPPRTEQYGHSRGFPEAFEMGLARSIRQIDEDRLPRSCSHLALGDRIVVPLFRVDGERPGSIVGLQARAVDYNQDPRVVGAGRTKGAVFADRLGLQLLRGDLEKGIDVILVEGATDFLSAATAVTRVTPPLGVVGVAGTGNAGAAIGRWVRGRRIFLAFDGDTAGRKATVEAAGKIHLWGGESRVTGIPHNMDVCSLIRSRSRDEFPRLIEKARTTDDEVDEYLSTENWPEPVPYGTSPKGPFPLDALPLTLRRHATKTAARLKVDPAQIAWTSLCAVSMACRDRLILAITPDWQERSNVFVAIVAPPGGRKSPTINPLVRYFMQVERRLQANHTESVRGAENRREILEALAKKLKKDAVNAKTPEECAEAEQRIQETQEELVDIEIPPLPRLVTNNASGAKLSRLLARHGFIGCMSADASPFDIAAGRWSADGAEDCDAWLAGWSGDTLVVDRTPKNGDKGDGEHIVHPNPRLVALVGAQPAVLAKLGRKDALRGIGFIARFFFVFPEDLAGRRPAGLVTEPDDTQGALEALLDRVAEALDSETLVGMTAEARARFEEYEARVDAMQAEGQPFELARDFASKFPSQLARVALVLHAAKAEGLYSTVYDNVDVETLDAAIQIMHHAEANALAALDEIRGRGDLDYVIRRIREIGKPEFSRRDLHRATQKRFADAKGLDEPLRLLVDRAYLIRTPADAESARTTGTFMVNPRALPLFADVATRSGASPTTRRVTGLEGAA